MQITKKFLEDAAHHEIKQIINDPTVFGEALEQEVFIEHVFSPYNKSSYSINYWLEEIIFKTIAQFPEKFLALSPEYFINSIFKIQDSDWSSLPRETQERAINRILPAIELMISRKCPRFNMSLNDNSFLLKIEKNLAAKILVGIIDCCDLNISAKFLSVLEVLSYESFKKVVESVTISYEHSRFKRFDSLPEEYRNLLLQAMVDGRSKYFVKILSSKNVKIEFLDKNAPNLITHIKKDHNTYYLTDIFEAKSAEFKKKSSRFALLAGLEEPRCVSYLTSDTLGEYARNLKPTQKILWASLLRNENITKLPHTLIRALKAYCSLKSPPSPIRLKIPDEAIANLSSQHLEKLFENSINEDGNFRHLEYNVGLVAQGLTSIAISRPGRYKTEIAGKLSLALEKYKHGESICEKICRRLGIDVNAHSLRYSNASILEKAIQRAISGKTTDERYMYVSFIIDLFRGRHFSEIQKKYREWLEEIEKENF